MPQDIAPKPLLFHPKPHKEWRRRLQEAYADARFPIRIVSSSLFVAAGFLINLFAIQYATRSASNSVTDIVLSNIPAFDFDGLFVYGTFLMVATIVIVLVAHPKRIPFALYALGLFWIFRAGFVSLTHIAPYSSVLPSDFGTFITHSLLSGKDQFFSGHTGGPFLFALMFWRQQVLRAIFLAWSVFFGVVVLLGHLHYSIDVAAAFFITYGIFQIALWLFPHSWQVFISGEASASRV